MSCPNDDVIDALLCEQFDGPVPAGKFCDRVMRRLPPRRRRRAWPLAVGIVAGIAACWLCLLSSPLIRAGCRDWLRGDPTSAAIIVVLAMVGLSILTSGWMVFDAEDR
ncbi:MAG: hypothetical protein ACREHV_06160 [Rhizomicrobium sp.]